MSAQANLGHDPPPLGRAVPHFMRYLTTFSLPLATLSFILTGPHAWYISLLWLPTFPLHDVLDTRARPDRREPLIGPGWMYSSLLFVLSALQLANVLLACRLIGTAGFLSVDTFVCAALVGASSGLSGIVVAHELVHRSDKASRIMARILMGSVLYEHFCTEHVRGHHARVGTAADPATARFGETFREFFWRTVPAQFASAWRLEVERLGLQRTPLWHPRMLRHRVLQGLLGQLAYVSAICLIWGWSAVGLLLLQAFTAVRLLESVNYFEHWGLMRRGKKVRTVDSWDTESQFTLYALVGLSRHADHHVHAARPYQSLRHFEESPKYPGGYITMVLMVQLQNRRFVDLATTELQRRQLGPYARAG